MCRVVQARAGNDWLGGAERVGGPGGGEAVVVEEGLLSWSRPRAAGGGGERRGSDG